MLAEADNDTLVALLKQASRERRTTIKVWRQGLRSALRDARLDYLASGSPAALDRARAVLQRASVEDMSELMMRFAVAQDINAPASFVASLALRARRRQLALRDGGDLPEWIVNNKRNGLRFARGLGLDAPERLAGPDELDRLEPIPGSVLKPTGGGGSRGVMVFQPDGRIINMNTGETIDHVDDAKNAGRDLLTAGLLPSDSWILEQVIPGNGRSGTARDLKFYTFYGRVIYALEIDRSPHPPQHCWWSRSGKVVDVAKYRTTAFVGDGPSQADVELAEWVSTQLPAPWVRVDFLVGEDRLWFGEFTARPGAVHRFSTGADRRMGSAWLDAENRLERDLGNGVAFSAFSSIST